MVLLVSGCGGSGTPTRHNDFIPLTSIAIVAESPAIETTRTIVAKTSTKFLVIGNFSGLFTRDISDQVVWSSNSPAVAEFITAVSPNRVSGNVPGSATLSATVGGLSATYPLTVSATTIKTITLSTVNSSVSSGFTSQFAAVGTFLDNTTQDLTFDATWSADTSGFASVSNDPVSKGLAKGLAVGSATIKATFDGVDGTSQLTVTQAILQSITVTPTNSSVAGISKAVNFTATGTYSDGTTADVTGTSTWDSSLKNIATITSSGGVATTVAAGTTSISATLNGVSGKTDLTVTALVLTLTPSSQNLTLGAKINFKLTATSTGGTTQDVTTSSEWTSSATTVATVGNTATDKGLLTGVSFGSCTITATYNGQAVTAVVAVQ
jgi:hypothetical protein